MVILHEDGTPATHLSIVRTGSVELAVELQRFVLERLPVFKRPHRIEFLSELPKTATGKVQRYKLRQGIVGGI